MQISDDPWLSERVGHPVFTLVDPGGSEADLEALAGHRAGQARAMYQARVDSGGGALAAQLIRSGFALVSTSATFSLPTLADAGVDRLRWAVPDDEEALAPIAERSFTHSRFHSDPQLDDAVADAIKGEWIRSCVQGARGDGVLVADHAGRAVGFLAGLVTESEGLTIWVIDLIAVDPEAQGRGLGADLIRGFVSRAAGAGAGEVRVGTQLTNLPAIGVYEGLGFRLLGASYDLHMHHPDSA